MPTLFLGDNYPLRFYLQNVVPSQHLVRPEVMDAFEQSVARNRDLLQRLAK